MIYNYDNYKQSEAPDVYLAYPNKSIIGLLPDRDFKANLRCKEISGCTFKINKIENGEDVSFFNEVELCKYLFVKNVGWFVVTESKLKGNGRNEYKQITAHSLEYETCNTYLTSFGALGVDDDEQAGLDRYCLYNPFDAAHSILHIWQQKNPSWSIAYVDPNISTQYRAFDEDRVDSYSFLMNNVTEVFECIFQYNTFEKTVSAFKNDNFGKDTSIYLSYQNLIKESNFQSSDKDIKTVFTVSGGNDATNSPLSIADINPTGNQISDFSYFKRFMSEGLQRKLDEFDSICIANRPQYLQALNDLQEMYSKSYSLNNKLPDDLSNMDWTQYGLTGLKEKEAIYKTNMSLYLGKTEDQHLYNYNFNIHEAIKNEIIVRENEIQNVLNSIDSISSRITELARTFDISLFLSGEQYQELSLYVKEDIYNDTSFVTTDIMNEAEVLEMKKELLAQAQRELSKVSSPAFTMELDVHNFTNDYDYIKYTEQLELGNLLYVDYGGGVVVKARLLEMELDWTNRANFKLTFSSKDSLDNQWRTISDMNAASTSASKSLGLNKGGWNVAKQTSVAFDSYRNSIFDASLQQIINSNNQDVLFDHTGIMVRKFLEQQNTYDGKQIWITNQQIAMTMDNWKSVGLVYGYVKLNNAYVWGLIADNLVGNICVTKNLLVSNDNNTFTVNESGVSISNASSTMFVNENGVSIQQKADKSGFNIFMNPNDPSNIFSITKGTNKLMYIDVNNGKLYFKGDIESTSGHIANFTIEGNRLTTGAVGISSDASSNAISFWAGSTDPNSAPFRVTNNGSLISSQLDVTGGSIRGVSLDIGNGKFKVTNGGDFTARNARIRGEAEIGEGIVVHNDEVYVGGLRAYNTATSRYLGSPDGKHGIGISGKWIFWANYNSSNDTATFWVDANGRIAGEWTISENYIESTNGAGIGRKDQAFWTRDEKCWISNRSGNITTQGHISCDTIYSDEVGESWSDKRLKDNIKELDTEMAKEFILDLKPVSYTLRKDESKNNPRTHFGLIAQDVVETLTQLNIEGNVGLYTRHDTGMYSIPYVSYIPFLIKAIQSQEEELKTLKKLIKKMSN